MGKSKKKPDLNKQNENGLDQFYTKPREAKRLFDLIGNHVNLDNYDLFVEPSSGGNSFGCLFPKGKSILMDIDPPEEIFLYNKDSDTFEKENRKDSSANMVKIDFLSFGKCYESLGLKSDKKIISIGNPPFGKVSSLAVKFFNICAEFSDCICFIIPRTFKRVSIQNRLNLNFHLVYNEDLPFSNSECVFEPAMNAKCCFQIWERKETKRQQIELSKSHPDWEFLPLGPLEERAGCQNKQPTVPKGADFAMKAYGSNCGEIVTTKLENLRPKSWHWFKCDNPSELISKLKQLDYSISKDSVRQSSLGKSDLVEIYTKKFGKGVDKNT